MNGDMLSAGKGLKMDMVETIFVIVVMLFLAVSIRVVPERQRLALFRRRRFAGLKGPGAVIVLPFLDRYCKINEGDEGVLLTSGTGKFGEFEVPVIFNYSISNGSPIKVVGFAPDKLQVM
jgi:regulator of protease activity HflC (stomatin/prohibitin superfamily)